MRNLSQYQVAMIAFVAGGLIVLAVFLLTSGGGDDGGDDQATSRTPTTTAVSSASPTREVEETPSATAPSESATEVPSATTAPAPAAPTATSPPAPTATATLPPTFTPTPTPTPAATATSTPTPTATTSPGVWHGTWETNCGEAACGVMNLLQTGNTVVGTYAGGAGTIDASVTGNRLTGTWSRNGLVGPIDFWMTASGERWHGSFDGYYGWCGRRAGGSYPSPCGVSSWYGTWSTSCPASCGNMTLQQNGTSVTGTYAGGAGTVNATVNGPTLTGTWMRNGVSGAFTFVMATNGNQFQGHYATNTGWCGYRNAAGYPVPCND